MEKIKETLHHIFYSDKNNNIRLDKFLFDQNPEYSRSYFQNLITEKKIKINGIITSKRSYRLKNQDKIEVLIPEEKQINLSPQKIDFEIVDIQKDFVVINKPAGLLTHFAKNEPDKASLVNGLLYKFKELGANNFQDSFRPGIVHRLDKNTSGLLIIARNIKAQIALSKMFKDRKIKKTYLVLVKGHPTKKGKIDFNIGRHPFKHHMMSHMGFNSKPAITYYQVIEKYKNCSLVEAKIITGRTHQVRVHFAAIGHGVIGDEIYGYKSKFISRQALHSWKISFEFNGMKFKYTKDIPSDFKNLLHSLDKS